MDKKYLTPSETIEFTRAYSDAEFNSLPYLKKLINVRKWYYARMSKLGYTEAQIKKKLNRHFSHENIWGRLRRYRKQSIISGDYVIPMLKKSHHKIKRER